MKKFVLTIVLQEDLHTGSGTGAGEYDGLLARDREGQPVIPASHWLGVWRYNFARYLRSSGQEDGLCDALFGKANNRRGAVTATALYCQTPEVAALAWTSTSRQPDSRAAQDDTLRTKEFVPAGTRFQATLWLADDDLAAALHLACRLADTLGARRQRGDGRITAQLTESPAAAPPHYSGGQNRVLRVLLRNLDPVCLPVTGHPGNIIESECYLRGQVLRGALVAWLLRRNRQDVVQSWLDSTIKTSNTYPLPMMGAEPPENWSAWQVLPMPLNINFPKPTASHCQPWWLMPDTSPLPIDCFNNDATGQKLKRPPDGAFLFASGQDQHWQSYNVGLAQRMRNSPPSPRHPEGALFTQEELPENTRMLAELEFPDAATAQAAIMALADLLNGQDCLTVGRGGAPLVIERWQSLPLPQSGTDNAQADSLTVTLTADLIARTPTLGFYDTLSPQLLAALCGLAVQDNAWQYRVFADQAQVHGFNAMTGLPRLPALAIRRGSALKITGDGVDTLRQALLKVNALGERCHEGFGSFRLDFSPAIKPATLPAKPVTDNLNETLFAQAEKAFQQLPSNTAEWPKLAQWQALRLNETDGQTFVALLEAQQTRLEKKENTAKIAWLKPGPPQHKHWLAWLTAQISPLPPVHQRSFYRALLAQVRRKLRTSGEHYDG